MVKSECYSRLLRSLKKNQQKVKQAKTDICVWNDIWLDLKQKKVENLTSFFSSSKSGMNVEVLAFSSLNTTLLCVKVVTTFRIPWWSIFCFFLHVCVRVCVTRLVCFTFQYAVCLSFLFLWEEEKKSTNSCQTLVCCVCVLQCLQYLFTSHFYIYAVCLLFRGGGGGGE